MNSKFPDMGGLVKYGHGKGLKVGWYENGCACGERKEVLLNYEGAAATLIHPLMQTRAHLWVCTSESVMKKKEKD